MRTSLALTPEPQEPDWSAMAYVPAGEFIMGIGTQQTSDVQIGSPAHVVYLDAFYIDRYETTVTEYTAFLNTLGGNRCDGHLCISENPAAVVNHWIDEVDGVYRVRSGFENRPVVSVSWWGAQAYCDWRGKRLPTDAEWEKAARGTDGRQYPWGDTWDPDRVALPVVADFDTGVYPLDVGTHPGDVSPYGVYDMQGNAAECVADWFSDTYYLESPYANPPGPGQSGDYGHVERGYPGRRGESGLMRRGFFCMGMFTGLRCAYTP